MIQKLEIKQGKWQTIVQFNYPTTRHTFPKGLKQLLANINYMEKETYEEKKRIQVEEKLQWEAENE